MPIIQLKMLTILTNSLNLSNYPKEEMQAFFFQSIKVQITTTKNTPIFNSLSTPPTPTPTLT